MSTDKPITDLVAYREWFHQVMPERIAALAAAVARDFAWAPDLSPDSLVPLGGWFQKQVEARGASDETRSLAMDVGMYFGRVIVENVRGTRWDQVKKNPRLADYGHVVIVGRGAVVLNPVRIAVTLAYAIADEKQTGSRLRELYDVWVGMLG